MIRETDYSELITTNLINNKYIIKIMGKFNCSRCKYIFDMKTKNKPPLVCPNCGRQGTVSVLPDADAIIKDSNYA